MLLVDLDPQGNATSGLGLGKSGLTTRDLLAGKTTLIKAAKESSYKNLSVLPTECGTSNPRN